ncbi:hypothetical protein QTN47_25825 [Danxiaibacter flavus]|uniref:TonB-dependent receptor n=1 Tax=Danxiaibacter flavus TaxID=3049108 RepID=A0ABV3ZM63_9BACT|nr:hypothetical protein QNM32_25825 [Chitinophagaceae bacterium DXS]
MKKLYRSVTYLIVTLFRSYFKFAIFLFLFFSIAKSYAQDFIITGQVKDSASKFLPSASISLLTADETIVKFSISDDKGKFKFIIPNKEIADLKWIGVSYSGYKSQRSKIIKAIQFYQFTLEVDHNMLQEVTVKTKPPISSLGDTIKYDVARFADKTDRSIGDVLKRMPGISVNDDDGTIYFNGKKISNLYIDGDDLMSGKYKLATDGINKDMIQSVDIIKNHQPINVLSEKIFSDATALNLVLKNPNSVKVSGNTNIGLGTSKQYDISVTPIILNRRIKAVDNVSVNNAGISYDYNTKPIGSANFISNISNELPKMDLSLGIKAPSELPQQSYYFNNSGIINLNNIVKTMKDMQFKLNLQALIDQNHGSFYGNTSNYTPKDTIFYVENQTFEKSPTKINGAFNLLINKKKYFFSNTSGINFTNEKQYGGMRFNNAAFNQQVDKNIVNLSNDINWIPSLGSKNIGELRWNLNYNKDNQHLNIDSGFYSQIPAQPADYDRVTQNMLLPTLASNFYINYKIPGKIVNQLFTAGYISEYQRLDTKLIFAKNDNLMPYAGDRGNNLRWYKNNFYVSMNYQVHYKKIRSFINLPVTYQNIHYYQDEYNVNSRNEKIFFSPDINVAYNLTNEQTLNSVFRIANTFGDLVGVYRGGILEDYRNFVSNEAALQEARKQTLGVIYNFQKTVKMFFANVGIDYNIKKATTLSNIQTTGDLQTTLNFPYENDVKEIVLKGGISKYLFKLRSNFSFQANYIRANSVSAINGAFFPYTNDVCSFNASLGKKFFDKVTITYAPILAWNNSRTEQQNNRNGFSVNGFHIEQLYALSLTPMAKLDIKIAARQSYSSLTGSSPVNYFFMDAGGVYKGIKRFDFGVNVYNLFNVKEFVLFNSNSYQTVINRFNLRGRVGMIRLNYYF